MHTLRYRQIDLDFHTTAHCRHRDAQQLSVILLFQKVGAIL
jgi:hypothetical protein